MLSYLHHLIFLQLARLTTQSQPQSLANDRLCLVKELVRIRVVFEKIRPLEGKLRYQIEKLVRKAEGQTVGQEDADIANGTCLIYVLAEYKADI